MEQMRKEHPLNIMEYFDWVAKQKFNNSEEHHHYVPYQEQTFLQSVVYPMFYDTKAQYKTCIPFPLVQRESICKKPRYVIDTKFFTIVFFSYTSWEDLICWEVSVHIKDHNFCDERITEFKKWYSNHYNQLFFEMENMPKRFLYPNLDFHNDKVQDFCIEFWGKERDFMLFKLFDLLRLF